jgi:hypothetical protein
MSLTTPEKVALLETLVALNKRIINTQAMCIGLARKLGEIHPGGHAGVLEVTQKMLRSVPGNLQQEVATFEQQILWLRAGKKSVD